VKQSTCHDVERLQGTGWLIEARNSKHEIRNEHQSRMTELNLERQKPHKII
jgi:hypothetical protein